MNGDKNGVLAFGFGERGRLMTVEKPISKRDVMEDELENHTVGVVTASEIWDSSGAG